MTDKNPTSDKLQAIVTIAELCSELLLIDQHDEADAALTTIAALAQDMLLDDTTYNTNNQGKDKHNENKNKAC